MPEEKEDQGTTLMKAVELIAITPNDAREIVNQYALQIRKKNPNITDEDLENIISSKIIKRYSKLAGMSGGFTSLTGIVPGIGTAISMVGGGLADITICMKFQIDMTMCLAMAINNKLSNEDAKHMSIIIALTGSLEQLATETATKTASRAAVKIVSENLKGATLQTIKYLFKQIGINFTKKAAIKAIPFGVGVIIGASANYLLTRYVGYLARDVLRLESQDSNKNQAIT